MTKEPTRLAPAENNGKWRFINETTGEEFVPFKYDKAKVKFGGETFFIDVKGNRNGF